MVMVKTIFENADWRVDRRGLLYKHYAERGDYLIRKEWLLMLYQPENLYRWPLHICEKRWDLELFHEAYAVALKALAPNFDADLLQASIDEARRRKNQPQNAAAPWPN